MSTARRGDIKGNGNGTNKEVNSEVNGGEFGGASPWDDVYMTLRLLLVVHYIPSV